MLRPNKDLFTDADSISLGAMRETTGLCWRAVINGLSVTQQSLAAAQ